MPSYIVKPHQEDNFYVLWSDVTNSPVMSGTRQELERVEYLDTSEERFDRADFYGTSAYYSLSDTHQKQPFRWQDEMFTVVSGAPKKESGSWLLPRRNLREYVTRLESGQDADALLVWSPTNIKEIN